MQRKIPSAELAKGMFVQDLDRPWIDTPFLLQGFLVEDDEQLAQLREFCEWVLVDPSRSVGVKFDSDPRSANKDKGVRPAFLPSSVVTTQYEDARSVEEETRAASNAFERAGNLLDKMAADIRAGGRIQVETVEAVIGDVVDSMVRNPDAMMLVASLREKDLGTYGHGLAVAVGLLAFGRHLGYPREQLSHLGMLGMLLDIGKTKVPDALLNKTGRLTTEEFNQVKMHVKFGFDILKQTPHMHRDVLEGMVQHHERLNGSGYPLGLSGDAISVYGRMSAIADTYAALTRSRPYAEAVSPHEALQKLSNWGGTQFQVEMVDHFIQSIGVFPVGSLVELSTGEVAIVVTHSKHKRLRPKVLVVTDAEKKVRDDPATLDLIYDVSDEPVYIRRGLPRNAHGIDPREYYVA